jgi:LacI family transcriptional regulator
VSRVLNNHPDVSEKTAARVRQAIQVLGYRPNVQARRLARNVSDLICFVLANRDFLHQFHSLVLKGVESYCSEIGRDVVFALWRYDLNPPPERFVLPRIVANRGSVDGVILAGANHVAAVKAVSDLGIPCVAFGNNLVGCSTTTDVDSVWYDAAPGTREAIEYLVSLGHRHIRYVGNTTLPWFGRNYRAFSDAMLDFGLAPQLVSIDDATNYMEIGRRGAEEILRLKEPTTAIFAGSDQAALAILQTLARHGVQVPKDMSLIGFDDNPDCVQVEPQLTTIHVPKEQIGAECAKFLFDKIANYREVSGAMVIPTRLVVRDSCAPPPRG